MTTFDTVESSSLDLSKLDLAEKRRFLHRGFESKIEPKSGIYQNMHSDMAENIARWLDLENTPSIDTWKSSIFEAAKQMLEGTGEDGHKTLGLKEISKWEINKDYKMQNLKQQAGFVAEVIGTTKENLRAKAEGTGITTYRADDRPDLFKKNDPYVDKIRVNAKNEIVERIQTKFVGEDGASCLSKLASKKYDKYFNDGKVDKIEIPKEFYDEIKKKDLIGKKLDNLEKQMARVKSDGKIEVAEKLQAKIDRYKKIDQMVERSTVTKWEAIYARKHPERYTAKLFAKDTLAVHKKDLKSGLASAGLTMTVSAVDHVSSFVNHEISVEEMVADIVKDTAAAGLAGYGTSLISTAVSQAFSQSSNTLIQRVAGNCLPSAAVTFAVESYDSISDFARGQIDGAELAYDLGESAAGIAGSLAGGAAAGAAVGTFAGPAGTMAGGIAGGVVGCALASEVYATAVEIGAEGAELVAEQAEKFAKDTIELVKETIPDQAGEITDAFHDFVKDVHLPFSL